jgi:hypothetical protein
MECIKVVFEFRYDNITEVGELYQPEFYKSPKKRVYI